MKILLLLFLINPLFGETLTFAEIKKMQTKTKATSRPPSSLRKRLRKAEKKLEAYRYIDSLRVNDPIIDEEIFIQEGEIIGGKIELGLLATNVAKMVNIVSFQGVDLPYGSKIRCSVYAKYKRVCGKCTRLIVNGTGQDIDADLLNRDGTQCVIGKLIDGKERYISGILLSEAASGALSLARSSIPTIGGNLVEANGRNALIQAGLKSGEAATELMKKEYESTESLVLLKKNSAVIISFNREVRL